MAEMDLVGVRVELPSNTPIALLRERSGAGRLLPIFIGAAEATAIAFAMEEVETPRPLTYDLLRDILEALGAELVRVTVTELRGGTFFAELELRTAGGTTRVSSRPSDALALALRTGSPIFASEDVLDEAGHPAEPEAVGEEPAEEVVEQFKEFIEHVNPEDFAS
jgi:bifunctional DNase/RNase